MTKKVKICGHWAYPVKDAPQSMHEQLEEFPNFHISGSVEGMLKLVYGFNAKLIRCGEYIYNVASQPEIYDNL